jgi:hypothetical protein
MPISKLLLDPLLAWYGPKDLVNLQQINKEHRDYLKSFLQTETRYQVTGPSFEYWGTRMRLYKMYPSIQKLTLELCFQHKVTDYLRSSLRSLHLILPLYFGDTLPSTSYILHNLQNTCQAFFDIKEYIQKDPACQLKELILSFSPTVTFTFTYPCSNIVEYDRFGPLYEDTELTKSSKTLSPVHCLTLLEEKDYMALQNSFLSLAEMPNWNSIQLPYHFPGAECLSKATYTDVCEIDTKSLETLQKDLLCMREH